MSYILNKTDGTVLTELVDGVLDQDTTDIALVGRNYKGYGEFVNENFVKMLENFANTTVPVSPLTGQLWYDTGQNKLKVYDGESFVPATGSFVSTDRPQEPTVGDTWFKSDDNQLYLYDGTDFRLVGPQYSLQQGESGILVRTIQDRNLNSRTVLEMRINGTLQAVISQEEFVPNNVPGNIIPQLVTNSNPNGTIFRGYNIVNPNEFVFRGSALRTERVVTATGDEILASQILRNDQNGILLGSLSIRSSAGLILGPSQNTRFIISDGLTVENTQVDDNIRFKVNSSTSQLSSIDAITVLTQSQNVGIFNQAPAYTLDVGGDARISGNLIVEGATTNIEVETLKIEDKNIELAVSSDSSQTSDIEADGGGITLRGDTDKTLNWVLSTESWTSSEHFDLETGKEYRIGGSAVLDSTRLYDSVTTATGITQVGTLTELTVDTTYIDGAEIGRTGTNAGLTIQANAGDISVTNSKITMLAGPTDPADAANKAYVDQSLNTDPLVISLDVTGWVSPDIRDERITTYLEALFPASPSINGKEARIVTFYYESQTVTGINVDGSSTKSTVSVQATGGGDVVVLEDVALPSNASGQYTPTVQRQIRVYEIAGGTWQFKEIVSVPAP